ncbi:MAG: hypothetical protein ACLGIJ_04920 [Candidatus Limnocylindria bacterium]
MIRPILEVEGPPGDITDPNALIGLVVILLAGFALLALATWYSARRRGR